MLTVQKVCPKASSKPAEKHASKGDKKQFATSATEVATEKRKRVYEKKEVLPIPGQQNILITSSA